MMKNTHTAKILTVLVLFIYLFSQTSQVLAETYYDNGNYFTAVDTWCEYTWPTTTSINVTCHVKDITQQLPLNIYDSVVYLGTDPNPRTNYSYDSGNLGGTGLNTLTIGDQFNANPITITGLTEGTQYYFVFKWRQTPIQPWGSSPIYAVKYAPGWPVMNSGSPSPGIGTATINNITIFSFGSVVSGLSVSGYAYTLDDYPETGPTDPNDILSGSANPSTIYSAGNSFSLSFNGLEASTTYRYVVKAQGTTAGNSALEIMALGTFTTSGLPMSVLTKPVTNLAEASATVNGSLPSLGSAGSATVGFEYLLASADPSAKPSNVSAGTLSQTGTFSASLSGLTKDQTYKYRAVASDPTYGIYRGGWSYFTPTAAAGSSNVTTDSFTWQNSRSNATLYGTSNLTSANQKVYFKFGTSATNLSSESGFNYISTAGNFSKQVDCGANGSYCGYFQAVSCDFFTNNCTYGAVLSMADPIILPTSGQYITTAATEITEAGATLNGYTTNYSSSDSYYAYFQVGTQTGVYNINTSKRPYYLRSQSDEIGGLKPSTTYYYRLVNVSQYGTETASSTEISFTTLAHNDTPTDISLSASSINENNSVGAVIGALSSTDPDSGNTFTYSLLSGTGDTNNASFSISGNSLTAASSFDYETKSSYSIRVRTTDNGGLTFEKVFTITVNNVNEIPTDISLSANSINENNAVGAVIGTLSSTDPDSGATFTYSLVSGTGDTNNASFNISGNSLTAASSFDYETKNSFSVRLRTTDNGSLTFEKVFTITINNLAENTITTIKSVTASPSVSGESYSVSVEVKPGSGSGIPDGSVKVDDGSGTDAGKCTVSLSAGAGSCSLVSGTAGIKTITAVYQATTNWNTSDTTTSHTVNKADTSTAIISFTAEPSKYSEEYQVKVTISVKSPGNGVPSGTVAISDSINNCQINLSAGTGSCKMHSDDVMIKTVSAKYSGDNDFNASETSASHTVVRVEPLLTITGFDPASIVTGQPYTASVKVTHTSGIPTGKVIISEGVDDCEANLNNGIGSCELTSVKSGEHTISAEYSSDDHYAKSTSNTNLTIAKADTEVTFVEIEVEPSLTGEIYNVSVSVSPQDPGAGTPTGSVLVDDGQGDKCTFILSADAGNCNLATFDIGFKTITAAYSGDDDFVNSSNTTEHGVTIADTSTRITASTPNPSSYGEDVVVSALVEPVKPAGGIPTGIVIISEDNTELCRMTLDKGIGECIVTGLSVGLHTFTATYQGETSTYNGSTSSNMTQNVQEINLDDNKTSTTFTHVGIFSTQNGNANIVYSLAQSGRTCNSVNGADNTSFTITGSELNRLVTTPAGTYSICVQEEDDLNGVVQRVFTIIINNPPKLVLSSLSHNTVSTSQTNFGTFTPIDGQSPFIFTSMASGEVCDSINSADNNKFIIDGNVISRTTSTDIGTYIICVQVTDAEAETSQYAYTIQVSHPPIDLVLSRETVSTNQDKVGQFSQKYGQSPFTYTLETSGDHCDVNNSADNTLFSVSDNILVREPSTPKGKYSICAQVTDDNGETTQQSFTIYITDPPSALTLSGNMVTTAQRLVGTLATVDGQFVFDYTFSTVDTVCEGEGTWDNAKFQLVGNGLLRAPGTGAGIYYICVHSTDANDEFIQQDFEITVTDTTDGEEGTAFWGAKMTSDKLIEGDPAHTQVGQALTIQPNVTFQLTDEELFPFSILFEITPGGALFFIGNSAELSEPFYPLRILATAIDGTTRYIDVVIRVMRNGTLAGAAGVDDKKRLFLGDQIEIDVLQNDSYSKNATRWVSLEIARYPLYGDARIGSIIYQSDGKFRGTDHVTYRACDDLSYCVTARVNLNIKEPLIPETGFSPGLRSFLPRQPSYAQYQEISKLSIEIPAINIASNIVGVPKNGEDWDVTWLGDQVGWLEGTAFPSWNGNSVLGGHNTNELGAPSIFANLDALKWGDEIIIHLDGQNYIYQVRQVKTTLHVEQMDKLLEHVDTPWLTLFTCSGYDEKSDTYLYRVMIKAVLVRVAE